MATLLYRLGRGSFRHRRTVLAVWILLLAGMAIAASILSGPSTTKVTIPGTEAQRALDSLSTQFPAAAGGSGSIVIAAPAGRTVTDASGQAAIAEGRPVHYAGTCRMHASDRRLDRSGM